MLDPLGKVGVISRTERGDIKEGLLSKFSKKKNLRIKCVGMNYDFID